MASKAGPGFNRSYFSINLHRDANNVADAAQVEFCVVCGDRASGNYHNCLGGGGNL